MTRALNSDNAAEALALAAMALRRAGHPSAGDLLARAGLSRDLARSLAELFEGEATMLRGTPEAAKLLSIAVEHATGGRVSFSLVEDEDGSFKMQELTSDLVLRVARTVTAAIDAATN